MIARIRTRLEDRDGQALVEFALVVPLILILMYGILDFGRALNYKNDLTSLANQAARFAEVNSCSPCEDDGVMIDTYVEGTADSDELRNGTGQITSPAAITFCFPSGTKRPGDPLKVTATATYRWLPYLLSEVGLPATTTMTSSVVVRLATAYDGVMYTESSC